MSVAPTSASPLGLKTRSSAAGQVLQETLALTRRLFLQLQRRPSTLVAGILQPDLVGAVRGSFLNTSV